MYQEKKMSKTDIGISSYLLFFFFFVHKPKELLLSQECIFLQRETF